MISAPTGPELKLLENGKLLICNKALRILPGKRLVYRGLIDDIPVIVKLFLQPGHGKRHCQREIAGLEALNKHQIPAPELLFRGDFQFQSTPEDQPDIKPGQVVPGVVISYLDAAIDLRSFWHGTAPQQEKNHWLRAALMTVAKQHALGVIQQDLHLGNFLLANQTIYTIDGDGIRTQKKPLTPDQTWHWVGVFFAQIYPRFDHLFDALLADYCEARKLSFSTLVVTAVKRARDRQRAKIGDSVRSKIFRNSGLCIAEKHFFYSFSCARQFDNPEIRVLLARLARGEEPAKSELDQGILKVNGIDLQVQKFTGLQHFGWQTSQSRGASCPWQRAHLAVQFGLPANTPVALVQRKFGPLQWASYYLSLAGERAQGQGL